VALAVAAAVALEQRQVPLLVLQVAQTLLVVAGAAPLQMALLVLRCRPRQFASS
jgi:hypothetical protein